MPYPMELAATLADKMTASASAQACDVFVGNVEDNFRGDDYRCIRVDVTRRDWKRLHSTLIRDGWASFGEDALVHDLPQGKFLIAEPSF